MDDAAGTVPVPVLDADGRVTSTTSYAPSLLPFSPDRLTGAQLSLLTRQEGERYLDWVVSVEEARAATATRLLGAAVAGPALPSLDPARGPDLATLGELSDRLATWLRAAYASWRGGPWPVAPGGAPAGLFRPCGELGGAVSAQASQADAALMSVAHDLAFVLVAWARGRRGGLGWVLSGAPLGVAVPPGQEQPRLWYPAPAAFPGLLPIRETISFVTAALTDRAADPRRAFAGDPVTDRHYDDLARRHAQRWTGWLARLYRALAEGTPMWGPGSPAHPPPAPAGGTRSGSEKPPARPGA